jgi:hypothetical protein
MQTMEEQQPINVGEILKKYIDDHRIFKSALTRKLGKSGSVIIQYQKRTSIQTEILINISHALKHNFFADIAALLPASYSTDAPVDDSKDIMIAGLQKEIELLKAREAVLMEMRRQG